MAFVKVLKNRAYFKRFQVKNRRRRECKTDYHARRKMVKQPKNKYNCKKYRLIVRFSGTKLVMQIAYATIRGDMIVAQAQSTELAKYGIPVGHKNYAAAYCTGLLIARRMLKSLGLDTIKGKEEVDGEDFHIEDEENERRPFKCILDVGMQRTVVGHRMWGALKGAVDGGLHVPHSNKSFPGFKPAEEKGQEPEYDAEAHKDRIFGVHLKEYMEMMQEEDPTKYEAHFSKYIENDIDADKIEEMYSEAHEKIREDPDFVPEEKKGITHSRLLNQITSSDGTEHVRSKKIGLEKRRAKVAAKIAAAQAKMMEDADDDDDE
jgi:large subunit ribosomal protein L5e